MKKYSLILLLLTGCINVPTTKMSFGKLKYSNPKQDQIGNFELSIKDTNGNVMTLKASNISATNNAQVISTSSAGQVDIINAVGAQVGNAAAMAVKAAVKP